MFSPVDPLQLVVLRRGEPKLDRRPTDERLRQQQVRTVELKAMCSKVDFVGAVVPPDDSCRRSATRPEVDDEYLHVMCRCLALDPHQAPTYVEDQVISVTVRERPQNTNAEPRCVMSYAELRRGALLIAAQAHASSLVVYSDNLARPSPRRARPRARRPR